MGQAQHRSAEIVRDAYANQKVSAREGFAESGNLLKKSILPKQEYVVLVAGTAP
jgi:hypothetical protein